MGYIDKASVGGTEYDIHDERIPDGMEVAYVDGYYEQMTVGNAEQVVATVGIEDKVPYNFRTSGGSADIGDREVDKLIGGTIAWNQLIPVSSKDYTNTITDSREYLYFSVTRAGSSSYLYIEITQTGYYSTIFEASNSHLGITFKHSGSTKDLVFYTDLTYQVNGGHKYLVGMNVLSCDPSTVNGLSISNLQFFDLTQMFGSTIADYVYSLETTHAGDGVAWFRKLFPKPYYAYNAGELMSVQAASHKMTGFNQWDEVTELGTINVNTGANVSSSTQIRTKNYIPVLPNTTYYFKCPYIWIVFYDANKNIVTGFAPAGYQTSENAITFKDRSLTLPENAHYMRFYFLDGYGTTYNHDVCINLHWDGERDGEYEPASLRTYALDSDLVLRGIPKLDADNKLYYDGDVYESNGTVTRRYGIANMGTFSWTEYTDSSAHYFRSDSLVSVIKRVDNNGNRANMICQKYITANANSGYAGNTTNCICMVTWGQLQVYTTEQYADAVAFQNAMNGVYLVYELATPTTETADTYQNPQIVDDWGTEEYVDAAATAATSPRDVAIPVGHDTMYRNNLRAKLEMAPESPDGDGDYIVRQSNGQNSYVQLTFPADELPAAPTTDGNYVLKCTVSSGTATFTWASP